MYYLSDRLHGFAPTWSLLRCPAVLETFGPAKYPQNVNENSLENEPTQEQFKAMTGNREIELRLVRQLVLPV